MSALLAWWHAAVLCLMGLGCLQVRLMHEHGYVLGNLDATIILQRPKLSPHKEKIRANLCRLLDAHPSVINIKVRPTCVMQAFASSPAHRGPLMNTL